MSTNKSTNSFTQRKLQLMYWRKIGIILILGTAVFTAAGLGYCWQYLFGY